MAGGLCPNCHTKEAHKRMAPRFPSDSPTAFAAMGQRYRKQFTREEQERAADQAAELAIQRDEDAEILYDEQERNTERDKMIDEEQED